MEIPCYSLSEDEYSGYRPLSADSDPEEVGNLPSPCEECESGHCLYLPHRCPISEDPLHLSPPSLTAEVQKERLLYPCRLCPFSTYYSSHLKRHMKTHNGEKPFCCPHCLYASAQLVNLKRHLRTHTGEKPFRCDHCSFSCSSPGNLKRHQRVHTQEKPYACNLCSYRCNQSRNLKRHLLAHCQRRREVKEEEDGEEEREEGSSLSKDASVAVLALPVTSNDLEAFLPSCTRMSCAPSPPALPAPSPPALPAPSPPALPAPSPPALPAPSPPALPAPTDDGLPELLFPFTCRSCGMVLDEGYPQDEDVDDGVIEGQYCSRCNAPPLSGSPGKGFSCVLCSFVTHYPNHLSRHMKTHSGEKPYKCQLCSYASAHYDNLKRHQRVHTGEKPYKCQLCDYACGNLANLKRHGRIHSGDKPFHCGLCNYSCNQSMNLKRHMLRHTGEKPFRCARCHYTTGHWDNYKRHQKTHGHSGGQSETQGQLIDSMIKNTLPCLLAQRQQSNAL